MGRMSTSLPRRTLLRSRVICNVIRGRGGHSTVIARLSTLLRDISGRSPIIGRLSVSTRYKWPVPDHMLSVFQYEIKGSFPDHRSFDCQYE